MEGDRVYLGSLACLGLARIRCSVPGAHAFHTGLYGHWVDSPVAPVAPGATVLG